MRGFNRHMAILYFVLVVRQGKGTYGNSRKSAGKCHILL